MSRKFTEDTRRVTDVLNEITPQRKEVLARLRRLNAESKALQRLLKKKDH